MELKKTTKEFVETVNEAMTSIKTMAGAAVFDENMDPRAVDMMKQLFKLTDVSLRLVSEQSNALQEVNDKLDKLLEKSKKKEEES